MSNALIDLSVLEEPNSTWIQEPEDKKYHDYTLRLWGAEKIVVLKFFPFQKKSYGHPFIGTVIVYKLQNGKTIASIGYSNGIAGANFTQEEIDSIWPVLCKKHKLLLQIDVLCSGFYPETELHNQEIDNEYDIPR